MPSAPLRPCGSTGCTELVTKGRCVKHRGTERKAKDVDKQTANARGYNYAWQQYRLRWLANHPFCGERADTSRSTEHSLCSAEGRDVQARVVDHIAPHKGDTEKFNNPLNHQSLCESCHNRKTATEDGGFVKRLAGERVVITGAPGSGKTTWVQQRARPGDIVYDLDEIARVVTQLPSYPRPQDASNALLAMREGLVRWLETAFVKVHVFVIVTDEREAAAIAQRLSARVVRQRAASHAPAV